MLQFHDAAGYTWYINHLISFTVLTISFIWACKKLLTGHKDKFLHYSVSAGLTILFICFLLLIHMPWWVAPIITFFIGLGKEVYDYFHPRTHSCDINDLIADTIGNLTITAVYLFSFIMYRN